MKKKNFTKMMFIGLILLSTVQIIQHFRPISDFIFGGLVGIAMGIMLLGLFKSIKLKNSTVKR